MIDPRVWQYESKYGLHVTGRLGPGPGQDGNVYRTDRATAVKIFDREERFTREDAVYRILTNKGISIIAGHAVPEWINSDSSLWIIEMTIVDRPFLLDFASARTASEVPDWEPHVLDEYYEGLKEKFGANWENALHVAAMFNVATGLFLMDLHPGNVAFVDP